ncbi:cytochrome bd-I ubiquinol oxidase subunit 2 apoprotein [Longilinea arvoryzae]|uniref:Cytochrome bd-I ubiquinol oxidase subunit 2 apoprotein n=1 Tax=Longilinea arvoryzae TaxID=360412 RepID=A0A0S7BN90_9CHLR|nr:cytochrome d ubiquinol oxidase subunit II [Longilinea arvoryzae]GAP15210.1 cytochrome bd-I ubiquinol oxidase subunit 2 apoprotein [Longilinea arvoryzae]
MQLNVLWFILIAILYIGYFVLEGFDFGVGILLPFLGKTDTKRRVMINTIGPHWDGNEVWLLTAGGATFAAFPQWYATLFSGFYLPLFLMLIALIVRGVAFEFRGKDDNPRWRSLWDWAIFVGSLVPALLWGVAFTNFVLGVPIDAHMQYVGGFWNLLNPYALLGGLVSLLAFTLHGAIFLTLKTDTEISEPARKIAGRVWLPLVIVLVGYTVGMYFKTDILTKLGIDPGVIPIFTVIALLVVGWFVRQKQDGWAFTFMTLSIALAVTTLFMLLFPRVLISSIDPAFSLTVDNASSSPYTLTVMSTVALIFVPIVLAYQGWTYWVFRKRVSSKPKELHY